MTRVVIGLRPVVFGACALVLAACTGTTARPSTEPTLQATESQTPVTPSPSGSPVASRPTAAPSPASPPAKACYQLSAAELTNPTTTSRPVSCRKAHNARTIYVGRLDLVVDGHALAVDSEHAQQQLATQCPKQLASYVGGSATDRRLSRFQVTWFSPTLEQSDQGADWFRCDLVLFGTDQKLAALPARSDLRHVLDGRAALDHYGVCGTAAPGAPGFHRVLCGDAHSWRAITTIDLNGKAYPGASNARKAGDQTCSDKVRAANGFALKFTYGWEWPTRQQWSAGQHYGFCWSKS